MTHFDPQLDCSTASESRDLAPECSDMRPVTRRLGTFEVCLIIIAILVIHWLGMQWFTTWLGDEEALALAQMDRMAETINTQTETSGQRLVDASELVDDGWRRTAKGWEYLPNKAKFGGPTGQLPTAHAAPSQLWPAAAAACMLLLIVILPDSPPAARR